MHLAHLYRRFLSGGVYRLYRWFNAPVPLYTPGAIRALARGMNRAAGTNPRQSGWAVFEWGSGASTVWYAARARLVTAVEHDPGWHEVITAMLCARQLEANCLLLSPAADVSAGEMLADWPTRRFPFGLRETTLFTGPGV